MELRIRDTLGFLGVGTVGPESLVGTPYGTVFGA